MCLIALLMVFVPALAQQTLPDMGVSQEALEESRQEIDIGVDALIAGLDFSALEEMEITALGEGVSFRDAVRRLAEGDTLSPEEMVSGVLAVFVKAVSDMGDIMLSLMLPVLLSSLLLNTAPLRGGTSGPLRSVFFVLILLPVILLVISQLEHTQRTITGMTEKMDKLLPLLLTLLTALGGHASSAFLHPLVVAASGSMVFLAREVILRLVMCTCAVTAINHLSDRMHLTRMAQLLRSAVCWLLGVSFTVFVGAMSLQGVCSASIDGVALRAAKYAVDNFVPIVGGMFSDTMDTLVGCALIVKNALGVCAVLVLIAALMGPLVRTVAVVFVMKLSAALLEPVADGEMIAAIADFSRTIVLFLVTMLCVGAMFFLLIVQILLVGNLTVLLR